MFPVKDDFKKIKKSGGILPIQYMTWFWRQLSYLLRSKQKLILSYFKKVLLYDLVVPYHCLGSAALSLTLFLLQILHSHGKAIHGTFVHPNRKHEQDCHNGQPRGQLVQSSRLFGDRKRGALNLICLLAVVKTKKYRYSRCHRKRLYIYLTVFMWCLKMAVLCTYLLTKYLRWLSAHVTFYCYRTKYL